MPYIYVAIFAALTGITVGGSLVGCAGLAPVGYVTPEPEHRSDLDRAWLALDDGRVRDAHLTFRQYTTPGLERTIRGRAYLGLGKCELSSRNPERDPQQAVSYLKSALPLLAGSGETAVCQIALAEAYLELRHHALSRSALENAFEYLSGTEAERTATLLSLLYEAEGFETQAALWRGRAGQYLNSPEYTSLRAQILPPAPKRVTKPKQAKPVRRPRTVRIVSRAKWGARRLNTRRVDPMGPIHRITIHHTADAQPADIQSFSDASDYLRQQQLFAQDQEGWADIGYHYLIDARGQIYEGRPIKYQGAHAGNNTLNSGNIGIALIGNFCKERPGPRQWRALQRLVRTLRAKHGIEQEDVQGHRHVREGAGLTTTICPGEALERMLPAL